MISKKILISGIVLFLSVFLFIGFSNVKANESINYLCHLDELTDVIKIQNQNDEMLKVYTYAKYPDYKPIGALNDPINGLEGEACVDDVARAVIVYLKHYSYYKDSHSLTKAKQGLNFVMYMQDPDGEFYNFMLPGLKISKNGPTSYKAINFWGARAIWSLSWGYQVFKDIDIEYGEKISGHLEKGINALERIIKKNNTTIPFNDKQVPKWMELMGSDCISVCVLGLVKYYELKPSNKLSGLITELCEVISKTQFGSFTEFPFSAFISYVKNPDTWHGWGNRQTHALTRAGSILKRLDWIKAAENEAENFYSHLLASDIVGVMNPYPDLKVEQIAYTISPMIQGLLSLYEVTNKKKYAQYAGLITTWFYGNNISGKQMFIPEKGLVFDGICRDKVNMDSGAESTIEGIMSLMDIQHNPVAKKYIQYKEVSKNSFQIIKNNPETNNIFLKIITQGDYIFYIHHKTSSKRDKVTINIDNKTNIDISRKNPFHPIEKNKTKISLEAGEHSIALTGDKKSIEQIIIQPVIESKTFINHEGNFIILLRNFDKETVSLIEPIVLKE